MNRNMKQKLSVVFFIIIMIVLVLPVSCIGHSGRTDSNGGHKDNKNASGLGPYHYHCGGNPPHLHDGGVCPYSSPAQTTTSSEQVTKSTTTTKSQSTTQTKKTEPKTIAVKSIKTNKNNIELFCGTTEKIDVTISPENATDQSITWKSSDEKIVSVNSEGVASAKETGEAEIVVETTNGKSATVHVQVQPVKVTRIEINNQNIIAKEGDKVKISVSVVPSNATNKELEWSVENSDIASIEDGIIMGKTVGTTKVFCSSKDGVVSETEITVEPKESNDSPDKKGSTDNSLTGGITVTAIASIIAYKLGTKNSNKKHDE